MASGEIAYKLGEAFGQTIGTDLYPVFNGLQVYYDEANDRYYNIAESFSMELGEGNDDVEVTEDGLVMHVKDTYRLTVIANPIGAQLPEISWSTTKESIVSVDGNGILTANGKGDAMVKAVGIINDEQYEVTCKVSVIAANVTELRLEPVETTLDIKDNPSIVLTASYGPDYADAPQVKWTSDDETVATVASDGSLQATVTAVMPGTVTIKVELADNPNVYATCQIVVTVPSEIETIFGETVQEQLSVYDLTGKVLLPNASAKDLKGLKPGIYIVCNGNTKSIVNGKKISVK